MSGRELSSTEERWVIGLNLLTLLLLGMVGAALVMVIKWPLYGPGMFDQPLCTLAGATTGGAFLVAKELCPVDTPRRAAAVCAAAASLLSALVWVCWLLTGPWT